jgi:hypothetical protein
LVRSAAWFRDIAVDQMVSGGSYVLSWFRFVLVSGSAVRAANRCEVADGVITRIEVTFDPRPFIAERGS